jgi:PAS domain S-box-containing protein
VFALEPDKFYLNCQDSTAEFRIRQGGLLVTKKRRLEKSSSGDQTHRRLLLLSSAIDQTGDGVAVADLKGKLLYVNRAFAGMHGLEASDLVGKHLSAFHSRDQMAAVNKAIRELKETGEFDGEIWHTRSDGSKFPAAMHSSLLRDESGKAIGMIATLRDSSEARRAARALSESEEMYRTLVETSPDAVTLTDLEGRITFVSPRTVTIHGGKTKQDMIGRSAFDFIAPRDRDRAIRNTQKTLETGGVRAIEYALCRLDGSEFTGELNASVIRDSRGEATGFMATVRDITERKKAEEEFRKTSAQLQAKHQELLQKNAALSEILDHIEEQREDYKRRICREIEQAVMPLLRRVRLGAKATAARKFEQLEEDLKTILSRDIDVLRDLLTKLSPRELEICELIKEGRTSKEISDALNLALTTVHTHRQQIRRKLGIATKGINLSTFLRMR